MKKLILVLLTVMLMGMTLWSCTSNENPAEPIVTMGINGYVQKGPFVSGSSIKIQELTDNFSPNGKTFETTTNNDFGSFSLTSDISTNYIEVIAKGYYFNEVSGELSSSELTLRAILEVSANVNANVNILTTLTKDRIIYLITIENKSFVDAKLQAENEILNIFGISEDNINSFEEMNISEEGTSNAILLSISATFQSNNSIAELSELISKINLDIKGDGTLDNQEYVSEIRNNGKILSLYDIRNNIEKRYSDLGLSTTIPKFEDFIDSDGDGTINKLDDDTWVWLKNRNETPWHPRRELKSVIHDNKIMILGGYDLVATIPNDIWSLNDNLIWSEISNPTQFVNDILTSFIFDGKIWVLVDESYDSQGVWSQSVWNSLDGITWNQVSTFNADSPHSISNAIFDNKIWIFSQEMEVIKIWNSLDGVTWNQVSELYSDGWGSPASTVYNNKLWIIHQNLVSNSLDGITWTAVTTSPSFPSRSYHNILAYNDKLWVIGGCYGGWGDYLNDLWYSSDGINWIESQDFVPWRERAMHTSIVYDNKIWVIGGGGYDNSRNITLNDAWFYTKYSDWVLER